jgi:hypothetical protein
MANEIDEFLAELSEAELDQADQIEKDVIAAFAEGWSEETATIFIRAVMLIRKKVPDMAIRNAVDLALREGITAILAEMFGTRARKPKRSTNGKLSGPGV